VQSARVAEDALGQQPAVNHTTSGDTGKCRLDRSGSLASIEAMHSLVGVVNRNSTPREELRRCGLSRADGAGKADDAQEFSP
jgi:hypothetical protein